MTPLINQMFGPVMAIGIDASAFVWFDIGQFTYEELIPLDWGSITQLPYKKMCIASISPEGERTAVILVNFPGEVVAMPVRATKSKKGISGVSLLPPIRYKISDDGHPIYKPLDGATDKSRKEESTDVFFLAAYSLFKIYQCSNAYGCEKKQPSDGGKIKIANHKMPSVYSWHTIKIEPKQPRTESKGGTHASPRWHQCRGHWRTYQSGKKSWVKDHWRGNASLGTVFKDYKV